MPLLALVAVFVVVPFVELYAIVQVAGEIGVAYTVLILVGASVAGSLLMRSQGRAAWRRFNLAMKEGRMPHTEVLDGMLIIFGGALLLTPGFLTDLLGLALLIPPSRAAVRRLLVRALGRRLLVGVAGARRSAPGNVAGPARSPQEEERDAGSSPQLPR